MLEFYKVNLLVNAVAYNSTWFFEVFFETFQNIFLQNTWWQVIELVWRACTSLYSRDIISWIQFQEESSLLDPFKIYRFLFDLPAKMLAVCFNHVTYAFQSESTLCICLNVKELLARNRRHVWGLSDYNGTRIHNDLVPKRTLNYSTTWPVWLNGWVFVYELSGCGFESRCSHSS